MKTEFLKSEARAGYWMGEQQICFCLSFLPLGPPSPTFPFLKDHENVQQSP